MQQAMIGTVVVMAPFMRLSGLTTPGMSMPDVVQVSDLCQSVALRDQHDRQIYLEGADIVQQLPEMLAPPGDRRCDPSRRRLLA